MKTLFVVAVVIIIVSLGWWYFSSPSYDYIDRATKAGPIIAFGDSLIQGAGASPGNNLVSMLSKRTGEAIVNAGEGGDTTAAGLGRLDADVIANEPRLVIMLLGGNDVLSSVPKEVTFGNLGTIIDRIKASGAAVLLLGIPSARLVDTYESSFRSLADEKRVSYVSNVLSGIIDHGDLMADEVHPNDTGYARIADRVEPVLRKMLE